MSTDEDTYTKRAEEHLAEAESAARLTTAQRIEIAGVYATLAVAEEIADVGRVLAELEARVSTLGDDLARGVVAAARR